MAAERHRGSDEWSQTQFVASVCWSCGYPYYRGWGRSFLIEQACSTNLGYGTGVPLLGITDTLQEGVRYAVVRTRH